jgi:hypothetical protein
MGYFVIPIASKRGAQISTKAGIQGFRRLYRVVLHLKYSAIIGLPACGPLWGVYARAELISFQEVRLGEEIIHAGKRLKGKSHANSLEYTSYNFYDLRLTTAQTTSSGS